MMKKVLGGPPSLKALKRSSPPPKAKETTPEFETDVVEISEAKAKPRSRGIGKTLLLAGLATTALAGCFSGGPAGSAAAQQLSQPEVLEKVQPSNPFELIRMKDGSIAIDADLANDDAYVLANGAAIRQDGGVDIAIRTDENSTLCEQAESLGGSCLNDETVVVPDPNGNLVIETFAREGDPIHRIEAKAADGISNGGVELNKLPAGTEVFSENGSGLLSHTGDLQQYPGF